MDIFEKCMQPSPADAVREAGLYPYFHEIEGKQHSEVLMHGRRTIMLGSNNYLGLTSDRRVIDAAKRALDEFGTGCSGSRFLNGTLTLHTRLERELAEFMKKEAVMTWSTGFQTNLGIISALCGRHACILFDRATHASLVDAARLSFAKLMKYDHNDKAQLEELLIACGDGKGKLIVVDGVFSMEGDLADLPAIVRLARKYGARVMVDDAHGLGVLGEGGRGTASYFGLEDQVDVYMGTFSKSLASLGGYMAASEEVAEYVRHASRPFIFSASIPPANCATALAALRHLEQHPELVDRLRSLSLYARKGMTDRGMKIRESALNAPTPIIPIYTYETYHTLEVAKEIYDRGVYVNPTLPPATPEGEALLRTSYMATHTEALLDEAMDIMAEVLVKHE